MSSPTTTVPNATPTQTFNRNNGTLFSATSPPLILAFLAIALFTFAIVVGVGRRIRVVNGRLILRPASTTGAGQGRRAKAKAGPRPERPTLWDLWTKSDDEGLSAYDWDLMPISAVKYVNSDDSQNPPPEAAHLGCLDRVFNRRQQDESVDQKPPLPLPDVDVPLAVAVAIAMPHRKIDKQATADIFEFCIGVRQVLYTEDG